MQESPSLPKKERDTNQQEDERTMKETYRQTASRVLAMLQHADGNDPSRGHLTMSNWEWPSGVALYGIYKTYQQSGDTSILD